jgi:hypothetical protein
MEGVMGNGRFLYNNFITDEDMLAVSSLRPGTVTQALKEGTGSATMNTTGNYTGAVDKEYTIEIDSIAGGAEVGQATFRWSDGGGLWNASGVTTPAVATELNYDIFIDFDTGAGADFVVGDKWTFKAINLFNAGKMLTWRRDDRYRSSGLSSPNTITVTFDAERAVDAIALYDHNLSSGATIALWGDDAATFDSDGGNAQVIEAITWNDDKILHYLTTTDRTKKYWQLRITDTANTDGYIEMSELFMGSYLELTRNFSYNPSYEFNFIVDSESNSYGVNFHRFGNILESVNLSYDFLPDTDITLIRAMLTAIGSRSTGIFRPVYFNDDSAYPAQFLMMEIENLTRTRPYINRNNINISLKEAARSV